MCVVPMYLRKEFKFSIGGFAVHNMFFLKACELTLHMVSKTC